MLPVVKDSDKAESVKKVRFVEFLPELQKNSVSGILKNKEMTEYFKVQNFEGHKKTKSSNYSKEGIFELPSIDEILARILKPERSRTHSRIEENFSVDRMRSSISPVKIPPVKTKGRAVPKKHYRNSSPLKQYNDRIFQLKRLMGK